MKEKIKHK